MALRRPGKKFREAYVACRFAAFRRASAVRLLPERDTIETPDFALKIGSNEQCFEITEADRPGRRRGDEDHSSLTRPVLVPDDEWTDPLEYQELVSHRVRKKAAKNYDECQGLLVWSNAWPIAKDKMLNTEWWQAACRPAANVFAEVWVGTANDGEGAFVRVS